MITQSPEFKMDEFAYVARGYGAIPWNNLIDFPYPYYYDHPPVGWILIGLFNFFFHWFNSITMARYLMSVTNFISIIIIYYISKRYYNQWIGLLATIFYGTNSYIIYLHRMILLDNFGTMFILLSILFIFPFNNEEIREMSSFNNSKKISIITSGFFLGLSILIKFPMLIFIPPLIIMIIIQYVKNGVENKNIVLMKKHLFLFILSFSSVIIIYISIAIFKGEFYSTTEPSLLGMLIHQITKESTGNNNSLIMLLTIAQNIPFLLLIGVISSSVFFFYELSIVFKNIKDWKKFNLINLRILGSHDNSYDLICFSNFVVFYFFFVLVNRVVFEHYYIPLIPFLAIELAGLIYFIFNQSKKKLEITQKNRDEQFEFKFGNHIQSKSKDRHNKTLKKGFVIIFFCVSFSIMPLNYNHLYDNRTSFQWATLNWIESNISKDSLIVTQAFFLVELHDFGFLNLYDIMKFLFDVESICLDWKCIDYIVVDQSFYESILYKEEYIEEFYLHTALENSIKIQEFTQPNLEGYAMAIYQVQK